MIPGSWGGSFKATPDDDVGDMFVHPVSTAEGYIVWKSIA